ncbi:hypothetical protein [Enterobacter ludwigii]|nr:hypothetical protein [Enterobacter ludwigii]
MLEDEQTTWLQEHQACGDSTVCLSHLSDEWIEALSGQYQHIINSLNR